jgi:hypothetical protein
VSEADHEFYAERNDFIAHCAAILSERRCCPNSDMGQRSSAVRRTWGLRCGCG